ncbi:hypothetical protein [Massilia scottii]|uniref:hypothetical protein n=1 Tax=Massilia scottii TaxID=3057166 RepID=UPI00279645EF|nr:hypothetical protein [Massilia sp. CCM 9029]MDQ1831944.1 hypothetical protein [Massilia sp. CCM 9029]
MITVVECTQIGGKPAFRLQGWPAGAWQISRSPFDAMVDLVARTLVVNRTTIYHAIGVDPAGASRCRNGAMAMPRWLAAANVRLFRHPGSRAAPRRQCRANDPTTPEREDSMSTAINEVAVKRLAGLANVISALLAAIPILQPESQADALQTCASMAANVADELDAMTRPAP